MYKALLKRKIMLFFLIVAMVASNTFMFPIHSNATGNCVAVSSSVSAIDSDNQFKVTFHFSNNPGMMGYKMILSYDASAINPLSVSQGKDFNVGQLTDNIGVKSGQFNVLWNHLSDFKGNGIAFEITFEKLADKYSEITVGYSQEDTFNEDWDDVILDCHNIPLNFAPAESSSLKLISNVSAVEYTNYFDVAFSLNNNTGLMGFKLVFKYDDSVLRPISVTRGSALTVGQLTDNIGVKDSEFNVLWNHLTNFTGNGQIFTIRFENLADIPAQIEVSYSQEDTFDENWNDVLFDVSNISVDLNSQETPTTPTMTFQAGAVNQNNQFDIAANLSGNTGIMGYKIMFSYDSRVLRPISVIAGADINVGQITDTIGVKKGQFNVLWNNLSECKNNGNAFIIKFELLNEAATQIDVTYSQEDTFNEDWEDVPLSLQNILLNLQTSKCKFTADFSIYSELLFQEGLFKVYDSSNRILLNYRIDAPSLYQVFEKHNDVDIYLKPNNRISFRVKDVNAVGTIDINEYINKANEKDMFHISEWAIGDVDGDDVIGISDISLLLMADTYGLSNTQKDLNDDEIIDIADISVILSSMNYGKSGVAIDSSVLA